MTGTTLSTGQAVVVTGGSKLGGAGFTGGANGTSPVTLGVSNITTSNWAGSFDVSYDEEGIRDYPSRSFVPGQPVYRGADGYPTQVVGTTDNYTLFGFALSPTRVLLLFPQVGVGRAAAAERPMSIGDDNPLPHQATDAERPLHKDYYGLGGPSAVQPSVHREVTAQYVDDTHLALKMMGDDGVVRSVVLVLA